MDSERHGQGACTSHEKLRTKQRLTTTALMFQQNLHHFVNFAHPFVRESILKEACQVLNSMEARSVKIQNLPIEGDYNG